MRSGKQLGRGMLLLLLGVAGMLFSAGCRLPGNSGYVELNGAEYRRLADYARGILWKANQRVQRNGRVGRLLLQSQEAADYVRTTEPEWKVYYTGDLTGHANFEWSFEGWRYSAECDGYLAGAPEKLGWSLAVSRPPRPKNDSTVIWDGPPPDWYDIQEMEEQGLLTGSGGKLEFDMPDADLSFEGAEVQVIPAQ